MYIEYYTLEGIIKKILEQKIKNIIDYMKLLIVVFLPQT